MSGESHDDNGVDKVAKRVREWGQAILIVGAFMSAGVAISVRWITSDVRADVSALREDFAEAARRDSVRRVEDAARWDHTITVVELTVAALVEEEGSDEQRAAVRELRRLRRVTR